MVTSYQGHKEQSASFSPVFYPAKQKCNIVNTYRGPLCCLTEGRELPQGNHTALLNSGIWIEQLLMATVQCHLARISKNCFPGQVAEWLLHTVLSCWAQLVHLWEALRGSPFSARGRGRLSTSILRRSVNCWTSCQGFWNSFRYV